jgi:hypothetical protein
MGNYVYLLLILGCPLMMIFMMRGMHGGHGGNAEGCPSHGHTMNSGPGHDATDNSLEELRRDRERLDREIERREAYEETPAPVGGGSR